MDRPTPSPMIVMAGKPMTDRSATSRANDRGVHNSRFYPSSMIVMAGESGPSQSPMIVIAGESLTDRPAPPPIIDPDDGYGRQSVQPHQSHHQ